MPSSFTPGDTRGRTMRMRKPARCIQNDSQTSWSSPEALSATDCQKAVSRRAITPSPSEAP